MNETMKTLQGLRTIHGAFADRPVSEKHMRAIVNCAVRAANASARQSYSIIEVSDREKMRRLCGFSGARLLVFCVDYTRIVDMARHLGHEFAVDDITAFITGSTDAILAAQTACIAARSLGIDSLFTNGVHRGDVNRVYEILGLPERDCFPLIALVLGYAEAEPAHRSGRLSGAGVVHRETYHRLTVAERDEIVARYDDPDGHLGLNLEAGKNWAAQGARHYLDWFYEKWSGGGVRRDTAPMSALLRRAGFLPEDAPGRTGAERHGRPARAACREAVR